jgi:hypothetical protein
MERLFALGNGYRPSRRGIAAELKLMTGIEKLILRWGRRKTIYAVYKRLGGVGRG